MTQILDVGSGIELVRDVSYGGLKGFGEFGVSDLLEKCFGRGVSRQLDAQTEPVRDRAILI